MARGDGRLYERGGVWWAALYVNGVERRRSARTTDQKKAERFLQRWRSQVARGEYHSPESERLTVKDLIGDYIDHLELRGARSLRCVRSHVAPILATFEGVKVSRLGATDIERFTAARIAAGDSPATCNRRLQDLRAALRLALKQERILRVPWIGLLHEDNARKVFYEADELERLVAVLRYPLDDITRLAFRTGMRRGEILGLRWQDVDRARREIRLPTSKNGRGRVIPLEGETSRIIDRAWVARRYVKNRGEAISALVFHHRGEKIAAFQRAWTTAHTKAELPYRRFHDLRHSYAVHARRAGVAENTILEIGGWRTRAMLQRYDVVNVEDRRTAQRRIAEHLENEPATAANVATFQPRDGGQR